MKYKCIVFGAGEYFESNVHMIEEKFIILSVADNNMELWGTLKCGYKVISAEKILDYIYDYVLICTTHSVEIQRQLLDMGIAKICLFVSPGLFYDYGIKNYAKEICFREEPYKKIDDNIHILFAQINPCTRTHKLAEMLNKKGIDCSICYFGTFGTQMAGASKYYERVIHFFSLGDFIDYVKRSEYDLIHCSNEPDILTALINDTDKPVVHDCHDFLSLRDSLKADFLALEYIANTKSDGCIYASERCMQIAIDRYGVDESKALYIENRPSRDALPKIFKEKLSYKDKQIHCVYEGGLSDNPNHFRFFEKQWLRLANEKIHVHFYTSFRKDYCEYLESLSSYIHYEGNMDIYQLLTEMTQYDVGLCTFLELPVYKVKLDTTSSNKIYEYLASGLPIAASNHLFHKDIIDRYGVGKIIDWNEDIYSQFKRIQEIGVLPDFIINNGLTMEEQGETLIKFYERLIKQYENSHRCWSTTSIY